MSNLLRNWQTAFQAAAPLNIPTSNIWGFQFSALWPKQPVFLILVILVLAKWCLMVLICVSLMVDDSGTSFHVLIHHLCIFSLRSISIQSLWPFKLVIFIFLFLIWRKEFFV